MPFPRDSHIDIMIENHKGFMCLCKTLVKKIRFLIEHSAFKLVFIFTCGSTLTSVYLVSALSSCLWSDTYTCPDLIISLCLVLHCLPLTTLMTGTACSFGVEIR